MASGSDRSVCYGLEISTLVKDAVTNYVVLRSGKFRRHFTKDETVQHDQNTDP